MAEIKWIKIATNMFDNRKIKQIRKLPEGDSLIAIWVQILCLAGQINENGMVYFSKDVPYNDEMLAVEFDRTINLIRLALTTFEKFNMIEIIDDVLLVSNWEKYQSADELEKIREKNRLRQQKFREKQKLLVDSNFDVTLPVTLRNGIDIDIETEQDINKDKDLCTETEVSIPKEVPIKEIFISLPLNDKTEHEVEKSEVDTWKDLYPSVNVEQELRSMKGWLIANPTKRKTKKGINRFINNWLAREQDKGYSNKGGENVGKYGNRIQFTPPKRNE
ncbi:MAG: phage replisome organizer N-terminal domain-containing protein [Sedimentibacter sp.]